MTGRSSPFPTARVAVLGAGVLLTSLDAFITFAAAPSIQRDIGAGPGEVQLLVGAYVVVLASLVVTGARLGERFGLRSVFRGGMALFGAASVVCAVSPSPTVLLLGRMLQGVGAGLMSPQGVAGVRRLVPAEHTARAMGWIGTLGGVGATVGQLLGGALIDVSSWRACFFVNVPIVLVALVAAGRLLPPEERRPVGFDLRGVGLSALGLGATVLAATQGREQGWPAWSLVAGAVGVAALLGFGVQQRRLAAAGGAPLVPPELLAVPAFRRAAAGVVLLFVTATGFYLPVALLLQEGLGLSPLAAGVAFVPFGLAFYAGSSQAHRIAARGAELPAGALMAGGLGALAVLLATLGTATPMPAIGACGLLYGLGQGMLTGVVFGRAVSSAPLEHASAAGGVVGMSQQLGNAAGVAVVGGVLFGVAVSGGPGALVDAFVVATLLVLVVTAGLVALARPPRRRACPVVPAPVLTRQ